MAGTHFHEQRISGEEQMIRAMSQNTALPPTLDRFDEN
jgi:hypothetical protein